MPAGAERQPVQVDTRCSRFILRRCRRDLAPHPVSVSAKSRQTDEGSPCASVADSVADTGPTTRSARMRRAQAERTVSDMITKLPEISSLVLLIGFAYLGFYVFGIVMGVFGPGEIPYSA